jgi:hypothetical protein
MEASGIEITVKGQSRIVPCLCFGDLTIIARGGWIKIASVKDEAFFPGQAVGDPEALARRLRIWDVKPDVLSFTQKITDPEPRFHYLKEWDNFAVLSITTYQEWLKYQAKKDVRENLRRAQREGVVVRQCQYNDDFVRGIKAIYDESPIRQGRPFWHYNKPFAVVKKENGTYLERSEYLGAYYGTELIGFLKMVYVGPIAKTMQVISKSAYFQKRVSNALLAKAIEVCAERGIKYFNYGPFDYPGKEKNSLTDFKTRHGFVRIGFPRYFIPLTWKGKIYLSLGLHRSIKEAIPGPVMTVLRRARAIVYDHILKPVRKGYQSHRSVATGCFW